MSKGNVSTVDPTETRRAQPVTSHLETIAECRSVPGVLSFSADGDILHMNAEAESLVRELHGGEMSTGGPDPIPQEVLDLCVDLQKALHDHTTPEAYDDVELRRVTGNLQVPVLLRGFLLPDPQDDKNTRLLILMEKIGRENRVIPARVSQRFRLTDREQEIVAHIADGRTNKEIAKTLSISEHTVKEHVRHLLQKTKTSTRTAILAQIYQDS